jgi:tetratricopeptide (TPR) repeat protein
MKRFGIILFLFAVAALTTIVYHRLNSEWVVFRNAETHFFNKQYTKAIPLYEQLVKEGFEAPGFLEHLGTCYLAAGEAGKALAVFEEMITRSENRLPAIGKAGEIYVHFGYFEKAAALYRDILRDHPDDRSVRIRLARVLSWAGRFEEAIDEYRKILGGKDES